MPPSRHIDPTFENETNCMSLSWKCHPVARSHAPRRDPVDGSVLREPQSEMMQICNTNNKSSLSEFNSQCCRSAPVGSRVAIIGSGSRGYGLGRFPVTLYKAQSEKPLGEVDNIRKFLDENADKLAIKE
jgi:hypothetical protein